MRMASSPRSMRPVRTGNEQGRKVSQSAQVGRSQDSILKNQSGPRFPAGQQRRHHHIRCSGRAALAHSKVPWRRPYSEWSHLGVYIDADDVGHGFLLDKNGALQCSMLRTAVSPRLPSRCLPLGINASGAITGYYIDEANVNHGFVRDKHGEIIEFDVPGAARLCPGRAALLRTGGDRILLRRKQRGSRLRTRSGSGVELGQI